MGRTAKHNWMKLFLEYNQGRYKSVAEFAEKKELSYDVLRKEFKKLGHKNEGKKPDITGAKNRTKTDAKNKRESESDIKETPTQLWQTLKQQFTDWPEEKLQAYLFQLEERRDELLSIPYEELSKDEQKELGRLSRERRAILSDPDPSRQCKRILKNGRQCRNPVERGKESCWNHGGAPGIGAPKGSKHNLKHGAYETIWLDQLDEEERGLVEQIAQDKIKALEEEIMLLTIRERRMLARITRLTGEDFTVVKIRYETGFGPTGPVDKRDEESYATLGQVQQIEEHLTKVQDKKLKAIELKHKIEAGEEPGGDSLDSLVQAIQESRKVNADV